MTVQELYAKMDGDYTAASRIMMMDAIIGKMIVKYEDEGSYGKLAAAWEARDAKGLFEAAHAMKGVTANLGLVKLSNAASEVCEEFRPGTERKLTDEQLQERMDEIRGLQEKALAGIREFKND